VESSPYDPSDIELDPITPDFRRFRNGEGFEYERPIYQDDEVSDEESEHDEEAELDERDELDGEDELDDEDEHFDDAGFDDEFDFDGDLEDEDFDDEEDFGIPEDERDELSIEETPSNWLGYIKNSPTDSKVYTSKDGDTILFDGTIEAKAGDVLRFDNDGFQGQGRKNNVFDTVVSRPGSFTSLGLLLI